MYFLFLDQGASRWVPDQTFTTNTAVGGLSLRIFPARLPFVGSIRCKRYSHIWDPRNVGLRVRFGGHSQAELLVCRAMQHLAADVGEAELSLIHSHLLSL